MPVSANAFDQMIKSDFKGLSENELEKGARRVREVSDFVQGLNDILKKITFPKTHSLLRTTADFNKSL